MIDVQLNTIRIPRAIGRWSNLWPILIKSGFCFRCFFRFLCQLMVEISGLPIGDGKNKKVSWAFASASRRSAAINAPSFAGVCVVVNFPLGKVGNSWLVKIRLFSIKIALCYHGQYPLVKIIELILSWGRRILITALQRRYKVNIVIINYYYNCWYRGEVT